MEINPKLNLDAFEASFHAIDTHTVGEFTRIITSGFPKLEGDTMIERKNFLAKHYDKYRQALMFEPRGHHDMFGALLTDPIHPEADFGVIFMDTGEYLNMCGHGTIGSVTAIIETGLVPAVEPYTEVVLDAPAGIIRTKAEVKNGKVLNVTLTNVPAFLYKENLTTEVDGREVHYDISFGGSFFALVDTTKLNIGEINPKTVPEYTKLGMKMMEIINKEIPVKHPLLDIDTVDLISQLSTSQSFIALPILLDVTNVMSLSSEIIWLTVLLAEPEPAQSSPPFTKKVKSKLDSLSYMKALSALSSKA